MEINNAYETLSDPDKRKQFDVFGVQGGQAAASGGGGAGYVNNTQIIGFPGGSAGGSFVCYLAGITTVNPLELNAVK